MFDYETDSTEYNFQINLKRGSYSFLLKDEMEDGISVHWWNRNSAHLLTLSLSQDPNANSYPTSINTSDATAYIITLTVSTAVTFLVLTIPASSIAKPGTINIIRVILNIINSVSMT
jgi:hypothetical protein